MKGLLFQLCLIVSMCIVQHDRFSAADKFYNKKQYKESITICSEEILKLNSKDPLYVKFLILRSDCYRELGDYQSAIKDCNTLILVKPKDSYYLNLSYLYGCLNDYNNCIVTLNTALKMYPGNALLWSNFSYYLDQDGRYEDGIKSATAGLALKTDDTTKGSLLSNRGYGYIGLKKYKEALIDINESIKINPDNSFPYCFRAIANINLKKFDTVCDDLNKSKNLGGVELTKDLIKQYCKN